MPRMRRRLEPLQAGEDEGRIRITFIGDFVYVTDSEDVKAPIFKYTLEEWRAFILGVKAGEFDV